MQAKLVEMAIELSCRRIAARVRASFNGFGPVEGGSLKSGKLGGAVFGPASNML